ncbi:MAG: CmpA/NrtA family ABC transporter substrate-binding protein [Pseudomonadota bacterium]
MAARRVVNVGFIPLVDAAPLFVAAHLGIGADEGLDIRLSRETSWATIRDRLSVNHLDVAHALAPLPLAANLGLGPLEAQMLVPICLGTGGNTITLATHHAEHLVALGAGGDLDPANKLPALAACVEERHKAGQPKLVFGIVHPHSAHRYQLAYWLASGGIIPGRDVDLLVLPPALMPAALAAGRIDGFCAGEPWGSAAVGEDVGRVLTTNAHIWSGSPEKVLAVSAAWAQAHPDSLNALIRAVYRACIWCDAPANRGQLADLLASESGLGIEPELLAPGLYRRLTALSGVSEDVPGFLQFARGATSFPWVSHAFWFAAQMDRWHETTLTAATAQKVRQTWRPDLYRTALAPLGADLPSANAKLEGAIAEPIGVGSSRGQLQLARDAFFDGRVFDMDDVGAYIADLKRADAA